VIYQLYRAIAYRVVLRTNDVCKR